jgi:hypothetical protein
MIYPSPHLSRLRGIFDLMILIHSDADRFRSEKNPAEDVPMNAGCGFETKIHDPDHISVLVVLLNRDRRGVREKTQGVDGAGGSGGTKEPPAYS